MKQRVTYQRRAVLMTAGQVLISKILPAPGPTHELHDVLAAAVALSPGPRVALLGFGGGSLVAPMRAMGFEHRLEAVDLDPEGIRLFWQYSREWAGDVRVAEEDAVTWLRRRRSRWDLIIEDLSVTLPRNVIKPPATLDALPRLMAARLTPGGRVMVNVLPLRGWEFPALLAYLRLPFRAALEVRFQDAANRLLIAGQSDLEAAVVSRELGGRLRAIGSRVAGRIEVRALPPVFGTAPQ